MSIGPPPKHSLKIHDEIPTVLNQELFESGILSTNTQEESLSIILYSPNLQIIASMDNSNSKATSSYTSSVTHGFTFSSTQSISISASVGVNIEIVTASVTTTFSLSLQNSGMKVQPSR